MPGEIVAGISNSGLILWHVHCVQYLRLQIVNFIDLGFLVNWHLQVFHACLLHLHHQQQFCS